MKIAIVGTGIAGNIAARGLYRDHDITVYEADGRIGGHAHTRRIRVGGRELDVDTGFIVYNERTYPRLTALFHELQIETRPSSMSFSVRREDRDFEYNGTTLNALFAQRRNLLRPAFLAMLREILRFNREAPALLAATDGELPLGEWLARRRYGHGFIEHYIVPMGAAIWSTDAVSMLQFPARFFVRFLQNHGMLSVNDRPQWRTVCGGSARYVERLTAPFRDRIRTHSAVQWLRRVPGGVLLKARDAEARRYDAVFLACHSDQALALLADPTEMEHSVLQAIPFQRNEAILHTDAGLLPRRRLAWAAWNYHLMPGRTGPVTLTYNMNILQGLDTSAPLLVTLNRPEAVATDKVLERIVYHHPLYTPASIAAQSRHREINGAHRLYFCGAWWRNGFHEDGIASAETALEHFEQDHAQRDLYRTA